MADHFEPGFAQINRPSRSRDTEYAVFTFGTYRIPSKNGMLRGSLPAGGS